MRQAARTRWRISRRGGPSCNSQPASIRPRLKWGSQPTLRASDNKREDEKHDELRSLKGLDKSTHGQSLTNHNYPTD
jgi:hypothetical protein